MWNQRRYIMYLPKRAIWAAFLSFCSSFSCCIFETYCIRMAFSVPHRMQHSWSMGQKGLCKCPAGLPGFFYSSYLDGEFVIEIYGVLVVAAGNQGAKEWIVLRSHRSGPFYLWICNCIFSTIYSQRFGIFILYLGYTVALLWNFWKLSHKQELLMDSFKVMFCFVCSNPPCYIL